MFFKYPSLSTIRHFVKVATLNTAISTEPNGKKEKQGALRRMCFIAKKCSATLAHEVGSISVNYLAQQHRR